jgi:hypothetical protein
LYVDHAFTRSFTLLSALQLLQFHIAGL